MTLYRGVLVAAVLSGFALSGEMQASAAATFELRGTVLQSAGISSVGSGLFVQVSGVDGDLQLSGLADAHGRFRFKKVPAGMYLLTAFVPRIARARRTIEVGPSFADRNGRVEVSIKLAPRPRRPDRFQVPAEQLGIPKRAQDEYEKGIRRLEKRDRKGASEAFSKALAAAPEFAAAHYQLGMLDSREGRQADAAAHFREALAQMPSNYQYLLSLGGSLLALRDGPQAVSVNEAAVRSRPDDSQAQAQLGFSYLAVGRLEDAEKHLKETVKLDPANYMYPQLALAEIYNQRQNYEALTGQLEEFVKLHPDSAAAREVAQTLSELRRRYGKLANSAHPR